MVNEKLERTEFGDHCLLQISKVRDGACILIRLSQKKSLCTL